MPTLRFAAVALLLAFSTPAADGPLPEWRKRTYSAPTDQVYAAALRVLAVQHHKPRNTDELNKTIGFHLGMTPRLGGLDMVLKVAPGENNASSVSIDLARAPQQTDGYRTVMKGEIIKILDGIQKELAKAPPAISK